MYICTKTFIIWIIKRTLFETVRGWVHPSPGDVESTKLLSIGVTAVLRWARGQGPFAQTDIGDLILGGWAISLMLKRVFIAYDEYIQALNSMAVIIQHSSNWGIDEKGTLPTSILALVWLKIHPFNPLLVEIIAVDQ